MGVVEVFLLVAWKDQCRLHFVQVLLVLVVQSAGFHSRPPPYRVL